MDEEDGENAQTRTGCEIAGTQGTSRFPCAEQVETVIKAGVKVP